MVRWAIVVFTAVLAWGQAPTDPADPHPPVAVVRSADRAMPTPSLEPVRSAPTTGSADRMMPDTATSWSGLLLSGALLIAAGLTFRRGLTR